MTRISYVDAAGDAREVDVRPGLSIADGALFNGVKGIEADCGGCCACATCHVWFDPEWYSRLPPVEELEELMLDHAVDRRETSRLSCQLRVDDALEGLVVHIPQRQYL